MALINQSDFFPEDQLKYIDHNSYEVILTHLIRNAVSASENESELVIDLVYCPLAQASVEGVVGFVVTRISSKSACVTPQFKAFFNKSSRFEGIPHKVKGLQVC